MRKKINEKEVNEYPLLNYLVLLLEQDMCTIKAQEECYNLCDTANSYCNIDVTSNCCDEFDVRCGSNFTSCFNIVVDKGKYMNCHHLRIGS